MTTLHVKLRASDIQQTKAYCADSKQYQNKYHENAKGSSKSITRDRRRVTLAYAQAGLKREPANRASTVPSFLDKGDLIVALRTECNWLAHWRVSDWPH
jgi:hypothetical protein